MRLNFCYWQIIHVFHQRYHTKVIGHTLKINKNNKYVCIHGIIRLIMMKMEMKMKNRSHRYETNRPKPRHSKYKKCLNIMMLILCNKQHLSNIWSSVHEKVKQHWGWVEKKRCLKKKRVFRACEKKWWFFWKYFATTLTENAIPCDFRKIPLNRWKW